MNIAARAGRWSAHNRGKAVVGWLVFVIVAVLAGKSIGMEHLSRIDAGNGESQRGDRVVQRHFLNFAEERVLVQARESFRSGDRAFPKAVRDVVRRLEAVPDVRDVTAPLGPAGAQLRSRDGRSGLVTFKLLGDEHQAEDRVPATLSAVAAAQRANPRVRIAEIGDASFNRAVSKGFERDFQKAESTSLPVTLLILLVAFGTFVAAGIPVLLGLTAVLATLGLLGPISRVVPLDETVSSVVLLIGLAVGVDYSMFYLRRKIEERRAGRTNEDALGVAAATSGQAVLVSGLTVMIAMAGMLLAGNAVFRSFAYGTMLVVAVALLGSVSVLPAVLAKLGDGVERGRIPVISRRRGSGESRAWAFVLDRVLRHPAISLALGAGFLLALAVPVLGMRTVDPSIGTLPHDLPIMRTYDRVQEAFPGGSQPAEVVVQSEDVTAPPVRAAMRRLTRRALATGQFFEPVITSLSPDATVAVVSMPLAGDGTDARSEAALATLRGDIVPSAVGRTPGVSAYVTGDTARSEDFSDTMKSHLPIVFAFVLGLAFVLLLVTFRSIVIPLTAIALNLLSVGAAYGLLTLGFQDGKLESVLNFNSPGGVITWLPLFLFVILFGLSMDYHVLILSRIREGVDGGLSTEEAVSTAIKSTAGVITSAAVVMVAVFAIFGTLGFIQFKMMGVGLAAAVLIDATIVRAVLVPSAMTLLGPWNWYLPKRLQRVPALRGEPVPSAAKALQVRAPGQ